MCHLLKDIIDPLLKDIKDYVTPIIAAAVAFITWLQWNTQNQKLRLNLYEKRFEVYLAVLNTIRYLENNLSDSRENELGDRLNDAISASRFLFAGNPKIHTSLVADYDRLISLYKKKKELEEETQKQVKNVANILSLKKESERQNLRKKLNDLTQDAKNTICTIDMVSKYFAQSTPDQAEKIVPCITVIVETLNDMDNKGKNILSELEGLLDPYLAFGKHRKITSFVTRCWHKLQPKSKAESAHPIN